MKKYIVALSFIFAAAFAFAENPYALLEGYKSVNKQFFEKFVSGKKTTYMLCIEGVTDTDSQFKDSTLTLENARTIFLNSIDNWVERTKEYIKKNGKEIKLKDIISILDEGKNNMSEIPCHQNAQGEIEGKKADLVIYFIDDPQEYGQIAIGWFTPFYGDIYISKYPSSLAPIESTLTHELGHAFGLADQYATAIVNSDFLYSSKVKRPSIMDCSPLNTTCDDADGFIASIDRTLNKSRSYYSLCADGIFIKDGTGVSKTNKKYTMKEKYYHYDAEVDFSYDEENDGHYFVDITLTNFRCDISSVNMLQHMGFLPRNDCEFFENIKIKIHGAIAEHTDDDEIIYKKEIGLWSFVLYERQGLRRKEKQVVMTDFFDDVKGTFIDLENKTSNTLSKRPIIAPLIHTFDSGDLEPQRFKKKKHFVLFEKDNKKVVDEILENLNKYQ